RWGSVTAAMRHAFCASVPPAQKNAAMIPRLRRGARSLILLNGSASDAEDDPGLVRLIFLNGEPVMLLRLLQQTHPQPRRCRALCQGAQMGGLPRAIVGKLARQHA